MTGHILTWSLLLISLRSVHPCADISLYNKALNETLASALRLLKDNLPYKFTAEIPFNKCERTTWHMFQTDYTVTFTSANITLVGSCNKTGKGCQATCPVQVRNLDFTVQQNTPVNKMKQIPDNHPDSQMADMIEFMEMIDPLGFRNPVHLNPYNVSVNYEGTLTIEINSIVEDGQPATYVHEPLFGSRKISREKDNFKAPDKSAKSVCVNKVLDAFEGLIFNKGWFWTQFDTLVRGNGHSASSKVCKEGSQLAVKIASCLDSNVNGEYLKCLRETMGWEEPTWDMIFDWICKGRININSLEICHKKLFTDIRGTQSVSKQVLYKCIHESSPKPPED